MSSVVTDEASATSASESGDWWLVFEHKSGLTWEAQWDPDPEVWKARLKEVIATSPRPDIPDVGGTDMNFGTLHWEFR